MKIGYPCINRTLTCQGDRTFRLKSYSPERFLETVENNLTCLKHILQFNASRGILFFRISSELVPFASHPVCTVDWQRHFGKIFDEIGRFIKAQDMRISMHPDQFTLINSLDEGIFARSVAELDYHCRVLDAVGLDYSAKIQIHGGGVYGDRERSMERFCTRYQSLPSPVRKRLVLENDDRSYSASECLLMHQSTGIPVLFDIFHHRLFNRGEDSRAIMETCFSTWKETDGIPMVDYSSQEPGKRPGSHVATIDEADFRDFIRWTALLDFDIMLEIKDKEKSALRALLLALGDGRPLSEKRVAP